MHRFPHLSAESKAEVIERAEINRLLRWVRRGTRLTRADRRRVRELVDPAGVAKRRAARQEARREAKEKADARLEVLTQEVLATISEKRTKK